MQRTATPDRLTVTAVALVAYAALNVCHEIVGHCGTAALLGMGCIHISSTYNPIPTLEPTWKYKIIVTAGCAANFAAALVCLVLLRRRRATPALRFFLWLMMSVSLFLPSSYVAAAPVISYGDSYILIRNLPGELFWRCAVVLAGGAACLLSFRLSLAELRRLVGPVGRATAWRLVAHAYAAGGVLWVVSALFSRLDYRVAQLQAAGGTFGLTAWLLLLPLLIPEAPEPGENAFVLRRSAGWVAAGALCALIFVGVLGRGIAL